MIRNHRVTDRPRPHVEMACAAPEETRRPLTGRRLLAWLIAAPFLAIGFAWVSYYAVKAIGVLIVIAQAVLS